MKYAINDHVIHPHHGAGVITAVENQELVEGFVHYYVIDIPAKDMTIKVPVRKTDVVGIRPAISEEMLAEIMATLQSTPEDLPEDFKKRQTAIRGKIHSGQARSVAEAIRDLAWHQQRKRLSKTDADLLRNARDILGSEIVAVSGDDDTVIQQNIDRALAKSLEQMSVT